MSERRNFPPVAIALAVGVTLWFITSLATGKREPWDASLYWVVAYPAAIFASAWLGYAYPDRPWRWVLILFESQFLAMSIRAGELSNLWPLGMALFAVVALPGVLAARLASRYGKSLDEETE